MDSLRRINLLPAYGSADTTDRYAVDFKQIEVYLKALNRCGMVSATYLNRRRVEYRRLEDTLRVHPLFEGPARGFDSDPILMSQDFDDLGLLLKTPAHLAYITADSAQIDFPQSLDGTIGGEVSRVMKYRLSRSGNRWLIDDIQAQ